MAKVRNLSPNPVTVGGRTYPPSGPFPRAKMSTLELGEVDGVTVVTTVPTDLEKLPEPEVGVYLIVSREVAEAARDRTDLLVLDDLVRDEAGNVIGARRFASLAGQLPEPGEYLLTKVAEVASSASPYAHRLVVRAPKGIRFPARGDWMDRGWSGRTHVIDFVPREDGMVPLCHLVAGEVEEGDGVVVAFLYRGRDEALSLLFCRPGVRYRARTGYRYSYEEDVLVEGPGRTRVLNPTIVPPGGEAVSLAARLADRLAEVGLI